MDTARFRIGRAEGWREVERRVDRLELRPEEADELHRRLERHQRLIDRLSGARPTKAEEARPRPREDPGLRHGQPPRRPRRVRAPGCPLDGRPWPHDRSAWQEHHKQIKRRHGGINRWTKWTPAKQCAWIEMMNQARLRKQAARRLNAVPEGQRKQLVRTLGVDGALEWAWANRGA